VIQDTNEWVALVVGGGRARTNKYNHRAATNPTTPTITKVVLATCWAPISSWQHSCTQNRTVALHNHSFSSKESNRDRSSRTTTYEETRDRENELSSLAVRSQPYDEAISAASKHTSGIDRSREPSAGVSGFHHRRSFQTALKARTIQRCDPATKCMHISSLL
jgi:hypothetical protein